MEKIQRILYGRDLDHFNGPCHGNRIGVIINGT